MRLKQQGRRARQGGQEESVIDGFLVPSEEEIRKAKQREEFFAPIMQRIGSTPRERLAWVVRTIQQNPKDRTPGDWDNLRSELAAFLRSRSRKITAACESMPLKQLGQHIVKMKRGYDARLEAGESLREEAVLRPNQEEAKEMLARMGNMIAAAVNRQPVTIGHVSAAVSLLWVPQLSEWMEMPFYDIPPSWADQAARVLGDLLKEAGSLLKECPASAIRTKEGETCGEWFVANRPKQEYCSATCQSRASTRAARAGTATPAEKRRKARKEG